MSLGLVMCTCVVQQSGHACTSHRAPTAHPPPPAAATGLRACWPLAAALLLLLGGCATDTQGPRLAPQSLPEMSRFYWPYAALAADVYRTGGDSDTHTAMAMASPWLRRKLMETGDPQAADQFYNQTFAAADRRYRALLKLRCQEERRQQADAPQGDAALPSCAAEASLKREEDEAKADAANEPNQFRKLEPQSPDDCAYNRGHQPLVPMDKLSVDGWERVPELHKRTAARGWRLFVPELAVDVWRRERADEGQAAVLEYAIVFRGTVGGGGWMSNFRGLTAMLPFVWDQYRQAEILTTGIIDQIDRLHALGDHVLKRPKPTRLLYTAVGHSLGGGLAQSMYLRVPRITRVVAFDPSPIDGASLVPLEERSAVTDGSRRVVDFDPQDTTRSAMHLLYEHGEFISQIAPCHSGPIWGAEGGPQVRCQRVNFARGNAFRQHNMAQMACSLYLAQRPARVD
jgi:pimeloyl-ACP methyl ester carboxylesterase